MSVATIGAALAVSIGGCGGSGTPTTAPPPHGPRPSLMSIFWAGTQLDANPVKTMQILKGLGVQVLRTSFFWANVANQYSYTPTKPAQLNPTDPATYPASGWAPYDAVDRAAAAAGMQLFVTLTGPIPRWAAGPGAPDTFPVNWDPSAPLFGDFVRAVGKRYSGHYTPPGASRPLPRIHFWSIWNEPNYGSDLKPQVDARGEPVSPRMYRRLLDAGWAGLQATGHTTRTDTILVGETAPYGSEPGQPGADHEMVPLAFIRALYCINQNFQPLAGSAATKIGCPVSSNNFRAQNPGLFDASGWATHPYTGGNAPTVLTTGTQASADYADFPALPALENTLDRAASAYGSSVQLPIYSTEFGYQTNPPNPGPTTTSPENAARYMNEAEYLSWHNPRIWSYNQYELTDQNANKVANFDTGLKFYGGANDPFGGKPKPSFYAYRMPLWMPQARATKPTDLEVWGCARAAPLAAQRSGKSQHVEIQFATAAGQYQTLRTVKLDPAQNGCYFDTHVRFSASGTVRLAWTAVDGVQYSRTQSVTIG